MFKFFLRDTIIHTRFIDIDLMRGVRVAQFRYECSSLRFISFSIAISLFFRDQLSSANRLEMVRELTVPSHN